MDMMQIMSKHRQIDIGYLHCTVKTRSFRTGLYISTLLVIDIFHGQLDDCAERVQTCVFSDLLLKLSYFPSAHVLAQFSN